MNANLNEIEVNGVIYVPKGAEFKAAEQLDNMEYCMIRTYSAGVFCGYVQSRNHKEVVLRHARRVWKWEGAATLSQLAMEGTSKPEGCQFPCEVDKIILTEVVEITPMTQKAKDSIASVPVWKE